MKKNKRILVTGGAGFVGTNLIKFLLKKTNYKIISIDNYTSGTKLNHVKSSRVRYLRGDTMNISKLIKKPNQIETIFHFGEFARIYQSFLQMDQCIFSNSVGSNAIFNFCLKNKIKLIYSATSASLGNTGKDKDLSPYAFTKAKNLELLEKLKKWFNFKYEVIYFYNVYGPGQIINSPMSAVIGIFEQQYKKNKALTVVKPGTQRRDFTHIDDIVQGCYLAWKKGNQNHYMLGTHKTYSIIEIAKMFETKIKYLPARTGERFGSTIINNNAKKILGYRAQIDIKHYIQNIIKKN